MSRRGVLAVVFFFVGVVVSACGATPVVPSGQVHFYRNTDYVAPSLGVTTDFQLYDPQNPDHVASVARRYGEVWIQAESFVELLNLPVLKEPFAVVGSDQLGLIDNYILPPGNYYRIPAPDVQIVSATVVLDTNNGILRNQVSQDYTYTLLPPGLHRALPQQVRYFPTGPQRYRLISGGLLDRTNTGEIDACQSVLCETTLSGVLTLDPAVTAEVDLEINFQLIFSQDTLPRLFELRDVNTIIRTYFSSPIRTKGKAVWGDILPEDMQTRAGWERMSTALEELLNAELEGQPIEIISVGIRGVELPESFLASQSDGAAEEQSLKAQERLSQQRQEATATAGAFERQQQELQTAHLAAQIKSLREALGSDDPVVICGVLNFFEPGSCAFPLPVSVTVDQTGR